MAATPEQFAIFVRTIEGEVVQAPVGTDEVGVFASDGTFLSGLRDEIPKRVNEDPDALGKEIGIRDIAKTIDAKFEMTIRGWEVEITRENGSKETIDSCLRWVDSTGAVEYQPIDHLIIKGRMRIEVTEFSLTHMKLGPAAAAFGTVELDEGEALLVITEGDDGPRATLRSPDGSELKLAPDGALLVKE